MDAETPINPPRHPSDRACDTRLTIDQLTTTVESYLAMEQQAENLDFRRTDYPETMTFAYLGGQNLQHVHTRFDLLNAGSLQATLLVTEGRRLILVAENGFRKHALKLEGYLLEQSYFQRRVNVAQADPGRIEYRARN